VAHWTDTYVGRPYIVDEYDCGHLAEDVLNEFNDEQVTLPSRSSFNVKSLSKDIADQKETYCDPITDAVDGDIALMKCRGLYHIGIYFSISTKQYVLHNMKNVGSVVIHNLRDLPKYGMTLEGLYRYRPHNLRRNTA